MEKGLGPTSSCWSVQIIAKYECMQHGCEDYYRNVWWRFSNQLSGQCVFGLVIHGRACIFLLIVWALSFRSGRLSVSIVAKER